MEGKTHTHNLDESLYKQGYDSDGLLSYHYDYENGDDYENRDDSDDNCDDREVPVRASKPRKKKKRGGRYCSGPRV